MLTPRTSALALALTALTMLAAPAARTTAAPAATKARAKPTCKRAHATTVAENRLIRVFTRPGSDGGYTEETDLVGCWKKTGRALLLAFAFDDDYVSSADFALVRIRGRFAAFLSESVDISCKAACPPDYVPTRRHLNVVDVRHGTGHSVAIPERPAFNRLLLDAHGAIAWPQWLAANQVEVRVVDGAGARAVDRGAIRPESLALTAGGRLSWVNDATARSTLLKRFTT